MKRVFITHILPREFELKYRLSVAAGNFSWNLINGGVFDQFYSIMPTYVHSNMDDVSMPELVYSLLRVKGGVWRMIAILHENIKIFNKLPKDCSVWMYNLTSLTLPLFLLLKWFRPHTKRNVIILDYTPKNDWLSRLCRWAFNHADGTIVLSPSPLFTVSNSACLPGVTPKDAVDAPVQTVINKEFLLSGVLNERISMVSMVLEAFSRMPELTLHITGFLDDDSIVEKYRSCPNIHYHGKLAYEDYLEVFHRASFQLSTRDPNSAENQCNFPSKVMEALLHNRIVVSTIKYPQLKGVMCVKVSHDVEEFIKDIRKISNLPMTELMRYANQSEVVRRNFNANVWSQTMTVIEDNGRIESFA